jgi:hypothetical protein
MWATVFLEPAPLNFLTCVDIAEIDAADIL